MIDTLGEAGPRIGVGLGTFVVLLMVGRVVGGVVRRRSLKQDRPSFAAVMSRVTRLTAGLIGLLFAVTIIFPTVKPVDVLGSLGFFSIAVGFAFRDILENLLAGVLLLFRSPFRTGDEVEIEGMRGTVQEINLRETVIRTFDGRRVLVPNATVYKNPLVVQTGYAAVRTEAVVGVAYEADVDHARSLLLDLVSATDGVLADPAPLVLVGELGVSTIDLRLLFWTDSQQRQVGLVTDRVLGQVVAALDEAGIEMPADVVVLQGTPSLKAALRDDAHEPTQGGGLR